MTASHNAPSANALKARLYCSAFVCVSFLFGAVPARSADDPIKIGVLTDMSGPLSVYNGAGSAEAARMAIEEIGGAVAGRPVELVVADHQNKPDIGVALARRWFDVEGVDTIVELSNTAVGLAVVSLANSKKKIVMVTGPGSSEFTGKSCTPYSVHWAYDTYSAAAGSVAGLAGQAKKWFFISANYAYGAALENDARAKVLETGGTVVGSVKVPVGTADFSSYILTAQSSGADTVALAVAGDDMANLVKQANEFGLRASGVRLVPLQLLVPDIEAVGLNILQGNVATLAFYHYADEQAKEWADRFLKRVGRMPSQMQAGTYSAVRSYLEAVRAENGTNSDQIMARLRTMPINDAFAHNGHLRADGRMVHDIYLGRVKAPAESHERWDLVEILKTIPGDQAFRPMSAGGCPLISK